jgi:hypothetical protein
MKETSLEQIAKLSNMRIHLYEVKSEFDGFFVYLGIFMTIANILSTYGFVLVFLSSFKYHNDYLKRISFDNIYITKYFRHVDARRYQMGKRTLLPLKKLEKNQLLQTYQVKLLPQQKKSIQFKLLVLTFLSVFTVLVIFSHYVIKYFMGFINRNMKFQHSQHGVNQFLFEIKGI